MDVRLFAHSYRDFWEVLNEFPRFSFAIRIGFFFFLFHPGQWKIRKKNHSKRDTHARPRRKLDGPISLVGTR